MTRLTVQRAIGVQPSSPVISIARTTTAMPTMKAPFKDDPERLILLGAWAMAASGRRGFGAGDAGARVVRPADDPARIGFHVAIRITVEQMSEGPALQVGGPEEPVG